MQKTLSSYKLPGEDAVLLFKLWCVIKYLRQQSAQPEQPFYYPLVLATRLCGAAAGNHAHRYIGKVCCLLLMRAEYIGRAPGRGPEGTVTGNCSSCYAIAVSTW